MNNVDICITYLNQRDKEWQKDYLKYKNEETSNGQNDISNRQAFGEERIREWDNLKYWLRAVEKNCSWVNKVFLITQRESQIPSWLNKEYKKIRIVYHDEFMPKELLPTFNAMQIAMYVPLIKDLKNNYIMCDDDYFFLNKIDEDFFFKDECPVHPNNRLVFSFYKDEYLKGSDNVFYKILNNNLDFECKYMNNEEVKYGIYHLPEARNLINDRKVLLDNYDYVNSCFKYSKFRHYKNLCSYLYSDLSKIMKVAYINNDMYSNCKYVTLKSSLNFNDYSNYSIVCFNDTEQLDDFIKTKDKLNSFLEQKFPDKSGFER